MLKWVIIAFFVLIHIGLISAQPLIQWDKSFGGSNIDITMDMISSADGNIIILIQTLSTDIPGYHGVSGYDLQIIKMSAISGQPIWSKVLGGTNYDYGRKLLLLQDGHILVMGSTLDTISNGDIHNPNGSEDIWLVKLNEQTGDTIWTHCYGGDKIERPFDVIQHSNGYLYVLGYTWTRNGSGDVNTFWGGNTDAWLLKLDNDGSLIWANSYGGGTPTGNQYDIGREILELPNGEILFTASTTSGNTGQVSGFHTKGFAFQYDTWVVKINQDSGNLLSQRCIGGPGDMEYGGMIKAYDNNVIITSTYLPLVPPATGGDIHRSVGIRDYFVCGFDANTMDTLWTKVMGSDNQDFVADVLINNIDSSAWIIGRVYNPVSGDVHGFKGGDHDIWIVKLNLITGDTIWTRCYGTSGFDVTAWLSNKTALIDCNNNVTVALLSSEIGVNGDKYEANHAGQNDASCFVINIDGITGEVIWSKTISSAGPKRDFVSQIIAHPDNGYVLSFGSNAIVTNPPGGDKTTDSLGLTDSWIVHLGYDTTLFNYTIKLCSDTVQFFTLDSDTDRTPAATYTWNFGDPFTGMNDSSNERHPEHIFSAKGTYTVMLVKEKECMVDTLILNVTTSDTGSLEIADTIICESNSAMIAAPANGTYLWSTGENTPSITVADTGIYWLQISNGVCVLKDSFEVLNYVVPLFDVTPIDTTISSGEIVQIVVTHLGDSIWWSPQVCESCETFEMTVDVTSNFLINLLDSNGCVYSKTLIIYVVDSSKLFIPNAFKVDPSGNTAFSIQGLSITKEYNLTIKNKRGETVFQSIDPSIQWNGYCQGAPCPQDVYTYYFKSDSKSLSGNVTLLK